MKTLLLSMTLVLGMSQAKALDSVKETLISTAAYPFMLTIMSTCAVGNISCFGHKEVVAVKADAQDYLAGDEATDSLINAVELVRASAPELSESSNEEIIKMIATLE